MNYLVSLNIISGNEKLLNPSYVPILYYWDEQSNKLEEDLSKDEAYINYIEDHCFNIKDYGEAKISYFKYNIQSEEIEQNTFIIQHHHLLYMSDKGKSLAIEYLVAIFKYLYQYAIKKEYDVKEDQTNIDIIIDIYNILKERNQKKILPETVRNYVMSELQQKYKLSPKNMDFVLKQYDDII